MLIWQLLRALPQHEPSVPAFGREVEITGITADSRAVKPGALFVAYPGVNVDGARFIPDALERGARAIVSQSSIEPTLSYRYPDVIFVRVPDGRSALAYLSAAWCGHPSRNLRVIGVTGTDGKTTTSTLIGNILLAAGHSVGTITTVAAHIGGRTVETGFHTTTPDAPEVQAYLAQMVAEGTEYAVIEATSHGLAQRRLDAVDFDIAVVTNITHEHLDLHGSWEAYRDAKALLFQRLLNSARKPRTKKVAVLNADDNARGVFDFLRAIPADERVLYTVREDDLQIQSSVRNGKELVISAHNISHSSAGLHASIKTPFGELEIESPLIGRYNVSNILAAVGAAIGRRLSFEAIATGIRMTRGIVGRMERIDQGQLFAVIVDFAHTPNALRNALATVRELGDGRVIVVFGCAGLRDVQKRAQMGKIAGELADLTIVTAEDPRTESLAVINSQIEAGLRKAGRREGKDYWVVEDRADAIDYAIRQLAQPGDVVLIAGKGHERSMCFGSTEYPWSDQDAARRALARM